MKQLHEIIIKLLRSKGLWNEYLISNLIQNWGILVGEPLTGVTRAKDFSRGRLRVLVQDPAWAHHLSLMKPQIIDKLNSQLGICLIKEIYFQVGELTDEKNKPQSVLQEQSEQKLLQDNGTEEFIRNIKRLQDFTASR